MLHASCKSFLETAEKLLRFINKIHEVYFMDFLRNSEKSPIAKCTLERCKAHRHKLAVISDCY